MICLRLSRITGLNDLDLGFQWFDKHGWMKDTPIRNGCRSGLYKLGKLAIASIEGCSLFDVVSQEGLLISFWLRECQ